MRRIARDVATMLFSLSYTRLIRLLFFVAISRVLGPSELGIYATLAAYVRIVWPLAHLGHSHLFVQHLSTRKPLPSPLFFSGFVFGSGLALVLSALGALGFYYLLRFPLPWGILFLFIFGEVATYALLDLIQGIFQGREEFKKIAGYILGAFPTLRLAVVVLLWLSFHGQFHLPHLILALVPVELLFVGLLILLRVPREIFTFQLTLREVRRGLPFSLSTLSIEVYGNIDKMMLAAFTAHAVVGVYTVAYRLVQYALFPLSALLTVSYPRFFRAGSKSLHHSMALGLRLMPLALLYAIAVVLFLWTLGSWLVQGIFGMEYLPSVGILKVLSLTLLFQAAHRVVGDALTGAGHQPLRTGAIMLTVLINGVLNLLLIPRYQGYGAAWATVLSEASLLLILLGIAIRLLMRGPQPTG